MNKIILKYFTKNLDLSENRNHIGLITTIIGIITNLLLFVIKFFLGLITFSLAIKADAFNNIFDSLSSLIAYFGFKNADKPADFHHPFGHGRFEKIAELFVSIIIIAFGGVLSFTALESIINRNLINLNPLAIGLLILTSLIKLWQYSFNRYVGKGIDSNLLLATAQDSLNDVYINIIILIALILQTVFKISLDGLLSLILSSYIIITGIIMLKQAIKELLGNRITDSKLILMDDLLLSIDNILGYHDLVVHQYGHNRIYATVHIEVDANKSLIEAHDIGENIEFLFNRDLNIDLVVHLDPVILDDEYLIEMNSQIKDIVYAYNQDFSIHDLRLIKHKNKNIISFDIVVNDIEISDLEIISAISKKIQEIYKKEVKITIDRNYLQLRREF